MNGPLLLLARTFAGLFIGLQTTLAFAYFGQSYEYYVELHKEAGVSETDVRDKHRVKNVLFTLFTVMTYLGYFFGEGTYIGIHMSKFCLPLFNYHVHVRMLLWYP